MRSTRTMMSWILLVAMLVSLPGRTSGHFVCMLGMAEAGAACPLCRGHAAANRPGSEVGNRCCKFVPAQFSPLSQLALTQVEKPILGNAQILPASASFLSAPSRELAAHAVQRASPRTRTPGYLSNFLRL